MKQRFIVNPFKCIASLLSCIWLLGAGICMIPIQRYGSAAVFSGFGLIFALISIQNGAVIQIDSTGITRSVLGFRVKKLAWSDIGEIGVTGTKIFNRSHPEKAGGLYLYVSQTAMTEQERFTMALKWPPMDQIYLTYNAKRLNALLAFWDRKIESFNTGDLIL